MATMTRLKLARVISAKTKYQKSDVLKIINATFETIIEDIAGGGRCCFRDFGVFGLVKRRQRIGRNPKKPHIEVDIPAHTAVTFLPAEKFKTAVLWVPPR